MFNKSRGKTKSKSAKSTKVSKFGRLSAATEALELESDIQNEVANDESHGYRNESYGGDTHGDTYINNLRHQNHGGHEDHESNWLVSYADMMTLLFGFFALLMSFSKIDVETYERARQATTHFFGGEYQTPNAEVGKAIQREVSTEKISDQMRMQVNGEGITVTFKGGLFFDAGAISLRDQAKELIEKIVGVLRKQKQDFIIMIEGHTDDSPINTPQFPSNWELSSFRAAAVLHYFERAGFPKQHLRAIGYGDTEPIVPNRDKNGNAIPENQSQNRRVVIRLLKAKL